MPPKYMLVDTHCHLDFNDFAKDLDDVVERAKAKGVGRIINVGSSVEGTRRSIRLAERYDIVYATIGVHPHEAASVTDSVMTELKNLAASEKVVAVGEVGLDYYRNLSPKEAQAGAFRKFIRLALDLGLPLILHAREANNDLLGILKEFEQPLDFARGRRTTPRLRAGQANNPSTSLGAGERRIHGVMHCFSGDADFLKECLDMGLFVSFTCNLTFKNAKRLREVAKGLPVERLLLETDAPFLAPENLRGSRNEPAYLTYLVDEWSRLLGLSREDITRITTHNANRLFGLGLEEPSRVAYPIRNSLYLNITNECTNTCDFCIRYQTPFVKGHNLKLEKEPTVDEILGSVGDPEDYKEVVFCGYGEPTARLDVVKAVAKELKRKGVRTRLVTNGHGDLINSRPIARELAGLIDNVSVSLNVDSKDRYNEICKPRFGAETYDRILDFIRSCAANGIATEVTCLDLAGVDLKRCEELSRNLGAAFRRRSAGVVG